MNNPTLTINESNSRATMSSAGTLQLAFFSSSCGLLLITAVAKIVSTFGSAPMLMATDPLFLVPFKHVMRLTAIFELGVAYLVVSSYSSSTKALSIILISSCFAIYRFGLFLVGYSTFCPCLGNLGDALGLSPVVLDTSLKLVIGYLLCGSVLCLAVTGSSVRHATGEV